MKRKISRTEIQNLLSNKDTQKNKTLRKLEVYAKQEGKKFSSSEGLESFKKRFGFE